MLFMVNPERISGIVRSFPGNVLHRLWFADWGFDWVYGWVFVRPFVWIARLNRNDFIDRFYDGIAKLTEILHHILSRTQTGNLRWYVAGITVGGIIIIGFMVLL
jgi:NADH-quinone oxidoreductase subunit L